jgi:hypothetical protein
LITIYSTGTSPRLQYITEVIFGTLAGIEFNIVVPPEGFDPAEISSTGPVLLYGYPSSQFPCIPVDGLLFEDKIEKKKIRILKKDVPEFYLSEESFTGYSFDFDIFSAAFYLLTEYEWHVYDTPDEHGRYTEAGNRLFQDELYRLPVVDMYAELVINLLRDKFPTIKKVPRKFDYKITFDIDSPYLYRHKGFILNLGGMVKDLFRLDFEKIKDRLQVLAGGKDPYDIFDEISGSADPSRLVFFFLLDRHDQNDTRFTWKSEPYRQIIRKIADTGIKTGIHPSYLSYKNPEMIRFETGKLAEIQNKPVTSSRMHFLKYHLPETFRALADAGITDDFTMCMLDGTGFRNFISRPVKWFDLAANHATGLTLHPTMVMDRSLQKYMGLGPDAAWEEIKKVIDTTRKYNGSFTILFHNSTLSETGEWKGWKEVYRKTVEYLSAVSRGQPGDD